MPLSLVMTRCLALIGMRHDLRWGLLALPCFVLAVLVVKRQQRSRSGAIEPMIAVHAASR